MHQSSSDHMDALVQAYLGGRRGAATRVLDVGSLDVNGSYRPLFSDPAWTYVGLDVIEGPGVDVIADDPYRWTKLAADDFDVVVCGQALEHVRYPWRTMEEIARVVRPGGLVFIIAPGSGPEHRHPVDCWRFLPDGLRALASWADLGILEVEARPGPTGYTDGSDQWSDCVAVATKGASGFAAEYERRRAAWSDVQGHLSRFYEEASRVPHAQVIELGIRSGNSTAAFLAAASAVGGHVWSVDVSAPSVPGWWLESPSWTCVVGDDLEAAGGLPDGVDVVFLDTSHAYHATCEELRVYLAKLRPGGVMLCHDTDLEWPEGLAPGPAFPVRRAIDDVVASQELCCEYVPGSFGLGVIRVPA